MKKIFTISILTYLLFTINSIATSENSKKNLQKGKILKIGVLLPLSGEFQNVGESFLKAIQLALNDISKENIIIYPRDSKANSLNAFLSAKELEDMGINVVIGPLFFESLERLNEVNNITFISLTNKTQKIPKNVISFGINIKSQIEALKKYFKKIEVTRTLLLSPKTQFINQTEIIENSELKFYRAFFYDTSPKKITNEIEKLTKYKERKKDLQRRIKILEKSDL